MSDYPDLTPYGYQINTQLGTNREGGRIVWQGIDLKNQKAVTIKQFCFAQIDSNWSGYKAYERELQILQQLDSSGIPKYLNAIETTDGFCLIQEYVAAESLDNCPKLTFKEIKQIALGILDILIYLQQQNPPILHRDLKPANILLDENQKVYLIDFGLASLGSKELSGSSVFQGTPGFIAPEQIIQPTLASDLYSLGITLVCLLAKQSIAEIRDYFWADDPYQLNLEPLLPQVSPQGKAWLKKMTQPKTSKRFPNAIAAKSALVAIDFELTPDNLPSLPILSLANRPVILGISAITSLSAMAVWGFQYLDHHPGSTLVNLAIAIVASIVVAVAELSAVAIAKSEPQAKLQGVILGVGSPILLVAASALIWGMGQAVDICGTIIIAEIFALSYFWWQLPLWQANTGKLKLTSLVGAIALGSLIGFNLLY